MTEWHINREQNCFPIFAQIPIVYLWNGVAPCLCETLNICEKSKNDFGDVLYAISPSGHIGPLVKINLATIPCTSFMTKMNF